MRDHLPIDLALPTKTQPLHCIQNRVHILGVFFFWIGVIKAHVTHAVLVLCKTKIDANAFGMTNVQVAVGLRRKARANGSRV